VNVGVEVLVGTTVGGIQVLVSVGEAGTGVALGGRMVAVGVGGGTLGEGSGGVIFSVCVGVGEAKAEIVPKTEVSVRLGVGVNMTG